MKVGYPRENCWQSFFPLLWSLNLMWMGLQNVVCYMMARESLVAFQCPIHATPMKHRFGPLGRLCGLLGDHYCDFLSHMILESDSSNAISWCEETWMCHLDTTFF